MNDIDTQAILRKAEKGIDDYLKSALDTGRIDRQSFQDAEAHTYSTLRRWLTVSHPPLESFMPSIRKGIAESVEKGRWENIVNAFRQDARFGTGGIRGMMAFDKTSIIKLKDEGLSAAVLKGTNTINDLVIMLTSAGVAKFGSEQSPRFDKIVIGYDSRIRGLELAALVAQVFLYYNYRVYFFDAPCPYPEVTFAIPHEAVKADMGVLISASHNDYRYNGFKLSCSNGSQFDPEERDEMYNKYIDFGNFEIINLRPFGEARQDQLWWLGGDEPTQGFNYHGREKNIIDMHRFHRDHIKTFVMTENLAQQQKEASDPLSIAFCPFHGAGVVAVPRLLRELGFVDIKSVNGSKSDMGLNELNGLFPAFRSDPGKEQQPDPGDPRAAETAVRAFKEDYAGEFDGLDILIGTDPDADRCGIVVKVPPEQQHIYGAKDYCLLPADDVWTLVLWYRLHREVEEYGQGKDTTERFITLSHTTSDSITRLALKFGLGVIKTWVGFAALAAATRDAWGGKEGEWLHLVDGRDATYVDKCHPFVCEVWNMDSGRRRMNVAAMEQSNGFSLLGGPPPDNRSLGTGGHVRDKDGTFAAVLVAEIAAWAKKQGTSLIGLLDKYIYLDPDIGLFATFYEPDPLDGEYPGIQGDRIKKNILRRALGLYQCALAGDLEIAGHPVKSATIYRTGKYDNIYPATYDFQFPDEGLRFFLDEEKLQHLTIRPSGTGNSLRFHIQLHALPTASNLLESKQRLRESGRAIMDELRRLLRAPRE